MLRFCFTHGPGLGLFLVFNFGQEPCALILGERGYLRLIVNLELLKLFRRRPPTGEHYRLTLRMIRPIKTSPTPISLRNTMVPMGSPVCARGPTFRKTLGL